MAEDILEGGATQTATAEPAVSEDAQPSEFLTEDALRAIVRGEVSAAYQSLSNRFTAIEQLRPQLIETLQMRPDIQGTRQAVAEMREMLERVAQNGMTEADFAAMKEAAKLRALEAENAALKQPPKPEPAATAQRSDNDAVVEQYLEHHQRATERYAKGQGLDWAVAEPVVVAIAPAFQVKNGRVVVDWDDWDDKVQAALRTKGDQVRKAGQMPPRLPDARGGNPGKADFGNTAVRDISDTDWVQNREAIYRQKLLK